MKGIIQKSLLEAGRNGHCEHSVKLTLHSLLEKSSECRHCSRAFTSRRFVPEACRIQAHERTIETFAVKPTIRKQFPKSPKFAKRKIISPAQSEVE